MKQVHDFEDAVAAVEHFYEVMYDEQDRLQHEVNELREQIDNLEDELADMSAELGNQ